MGIERNVTSLPLRFVVKLQSGLSGRGTGTFVNVNNSFAGKFLVRTTLARTFQPRSWFLGGCPYSSRMLFTHLLERSPRRLRVPVPSIRYVSRRSQLVLTKPFS